MKWGLLLLFAVFMAAADEEPTSAKPAPLLKLTSLEWPPYTGADLEGQGEVTLLLRTLLTELGYQLQVDFLPWPAAVAKVRHGKEGHLGYFPEYPLTDPDYLLSVAIGYSELGLIEQRDNPLLLTDVRQLSTLRFGVVQDYLNMVKLDALIATGELKPLISQSDRDNVLKVLNGELDTAVIDNRVLQYLLQYDGQIKRKAADSLQFSQSLKEHKSLHLVLKNTPQNVELMKKINQKVRLYKTRFFSPSLK
ncbi:transporter substrate-binding domain-containing protein [Rheinheimera sp.]|uniref:transporter substrate-binding domain-containing protein n=1 Tax=Rheinheimera sp. TaxID=1869214 RepID=UPI0027B9B4BE|nr:transporter substrate-binding domain-containing protein [Rheinheimera sp.]